MIIIIDQNGVEQDIEYYRQRIIIPDGKKEEIEVFVQQKEAELNEWDIKNDRGNWESHWKRFDMLMKEFLTQATYVENLLDSPFIPSERSFEQMQYFREWCDLETSQDITLENSHINWYQWINKNMYYIEKLKRSGLDVQLSDSEKTVILNVEEICFQEMKDPMWGYTMFIKMFNRHKSLGLPTDIDPQRKKKLEAILQGFIDLEPLCAAKLPPSTNVAAASRCSPDHLTAPTVCLKTSTLNPAPADTIPISEGSNAFLETFLNSSIIVSEIWNPKF